jgi:hypothetical protein
MRAILGLVLGLLIAGSAARAGDDGDFIKIGATYYIWTLAGAPIPFEATHSGNGSTATVKIIQPGKAQWYWVEFDVDDVPPEKSGTVTIYRKRRWLNFAQALGFELAEETNYAQIYPQGFKIVPYDGLGP